MLQLPYRARNIIVNLCATQVILLTQIFSLIRLILFLTWFYICIIVILYRHYAYVLIVTGCLDSNRMHQSCCIKSRLQISYRHLHSQYQFEVVIQLCRVYMNYQRIKIKVQQLLMLNILCSTLQDIQNLAELDNMIASVDSTCFTAIQRDVSFD